MLIPFSEQAIISGFLYTIILGEVFIIFTLYGIAQPSAPNLRDSSKW